MSNVVAFPPKASGEAKCVGCGHTWRAERYDNERIFECPECGEVKASFRHYHRPDEETLTWVCDLCDSDLFIILTHGVMCINCGNQTSWIELLE